MMKNIFSPLFAAVLLVAPAWNTVCAQDIPDGSKVELPSFPENQYIHGPKITKDNLKGKVVFFEYWGINCPPCIASMPHLQELQERYGAKGFTVVGSHSQALNDNVGKFLKDKKITFPVYQQIQIKGAGTKGGIPYAVLIGASGKIVARGNPTQLYNLVKKEVDKLAKGYPILDNVKLDKYKSLEKSVVSKGSNIESKITPLRSKTDDQEAQEICRAYDEWLAETRVSVQNKLTSNPLDAVVAIMELKTAVPSVTEFDAELAKLKSHRDLPKLASLQKKIKDMEQKKIKRGKVSESDLKSVNKELEQYTSSTDPITSSVAAKLKEAVAALVPPADQSPAS